MAKKIDYALNIACTQMGINFLRSSIKAENS